MKNLHPYYQTLFVVWTNQILFWSATVLFFDVYTVFVIIAASYFFGCISEISIHRYLSHKTYKTTPMKEKVLLFFAFLTGQGATLSWVAVHRCHHAYEDTEQDPHSPLFIPAWKLILGLFPRQDYKISVIADLIRSKNKAYFIFENKYYWLLWTALWITTYFISFYLFYFIVAGSAMWYLMTCAVNIFAHGKIGVKTNENAVGLNSTVLNVLTGAGHHNNHHSDPKNYSYKVTNETDIYAWVIEKVFKV